MDSLFFVEPKIQNSNSFLEDLRKINQLKDRPYQKDIKTQEILNTLKNKFKR